MNSVASFSSMAASGPALGLAIGRHFENTFLGLAGARGAVSEPDFFRMVSGEPHQLGNCAILPDQLKLPNVHAAVAPLSAISVPSAVIFPGMKVSLEARAYLSEQGYADAGLVPAMEVEIAQLKCTSLPEGPQNRLTHRLKPVLRPSEPLLRWTRPETSISATDVSQS